MSSSLQVKVLVRLQRLIAYDKRKLALFLYETLTVVIRQTNFNETNQGIDQ